MVLDLWLGVTQIMRGNSCHQYMSNCIRLAVRDLEHTSRGALAEMTHIMREESHVTTLCPTVSDWQ